MSYYNGNTRKQFDEKEKQRNEKLKETLSNAYKGMYNTGKKIYDFFPSSQYSMNFPVKDGALSRTLNTGSKIANAGNTAVKVGNGLNKAGNILAKSTNPGISNVGNKIVNAGTKLNTVGNNYNDVLGNSLSKINPFTGQGTALNGSSGITNTIGTQGSLNSLSGALGSTLPETLGTTGATIGSTGSALTGAGAGSSALGSALAAETGGAAAGTGSALSGALAAEAGGAAGAGLSGLGAAGAAGTGAAGAGATAALGAVAAPLAIAAALYLMYDSAKKKQDAKIMNVSANENAKEVNKSEQEAMNNIANLSQSPEMTALPSTNVPQVTNDTSNANLIGDLLGQYSALSGNVPTEEIPPVENITPGQTTTPDITSDGQPTDGTAPVDNKQGLIDDIMKGYAENISNGFSIDNLKSNKDKNFANRIGEFAGTTQRLASNPYLQGLVAAGVDKYNGNSLGKSILTGVNWAQEKAKSDKYKELITGNTTPSLFGGWGVDDYKANVDAQYKNTMAGVAQNNSDINAYYKLNQLVLRQKQLEHKIENDKATLAERKEYHQNSLAIQRQRNAIAQQNANTQAERARAYVKNLGGKNGNGLNKIEKTKIMTNWVEQETPEDKMNYILKQSRIHGWGVTQDEINSLLSNGANWDTIMQLAMTPDEELYD